jgi:hypothetical protein
LARRAQEASDVFVNCPFDDDFAPIFRGFIFAIYACGFRPRSARELDDGGQARIEKLYNLIDQCRYAVHDLSRTELDPVNQLPRFNMPLELGIFLGAKRFGDERQKKKRCLVLDVEPYRYQRFISDLAGMDIVDHAGNVETAIQRVRNWLANVSRRELPAAPLVVNTYQRFEATRPALAAGLGFDPNQIPYVDFERMVVGWLTAPAPEA